MMRRFVGMIRKTAKSAQTAWSILGLSVLLLLLGEGGLRLSTYVKDRWIDRDLVSSLIDRRVVADGYHRQAWTSGYYRELLDTRRVMGWTPYVYYRQQPYQGQHIQVDDTGIRRTWRADEPSHRRDDPSFRVFVFGGSTIWGIGARDDYTVPSCLAKHLAEMGVRAQVTNYGESGYVSTQEVIALFRRLQQGDVPDLVVFYDGVNDTYAAYQSQQAGLTSNEENRRKEFNLLKDGRRLQGAYVHHLWDHFVGMQRLVKAIRWRAASVASLLGATPEVSGSASVWGISDALADDVVRVYETNVRTVQELASAYGFEALFYWQPVIFTKRKLSPYEAKEYAVKQHVKESFLKVYDRVASSPTLAQNKRFQDMSRVFWDLEAPYFVDDCHLTEDGNMVVAKQIGQAVASILQARARAAKTRLAADADRHEDQTLTARSPLTDARTTPTWDHRADADDDVPLRVR